MDCESQGIDLPSVSKYQAKITIAAVAVMIDDDIIYNEENQENILNKENDNQFNSFISNNSVVQEKKM